MQPDPTTPNGWELADRQAGVRFQELQQAVDPAQVQGELRAFLVQRGRQVARDLRLPHTTDQELAQLGRLDCIDQHPTLDPDLAQYLELVAHNLERQIPRSKAGQPPRPSAGGLEFRAPLTGARSSQRRVRSPQTHVRNEKSVRPPIRDHPDEEWS